MGLLAIGLACGSPSNDSSREESSGTPGGTQAADHGTTSTLPRDPLAAVGLDDLRPLPRLSWPTVSPHITSSFGWRINPITGAGTKLHRGLDLRGAIGDPALAIGDGEVAFAGHDPFLGTCVIVDHGAGLTSWYGHLSDLLVHQGMAVERGAALGLIGNTGRSQAPHLHLTVKIGERAIDPLWVLGAPAYAYPALRDEPDEPDEPANEHHRP